MILRKKKVIAVEKIIVKRGMHLIYFLLPKIESLGNLAYIFIAVVAFLESTAFVGLVVPGSTIVVVAGMLSAQGVLHFGNLVLAVAIGGICGDAVAFFLGSKYGHVLFTQKSKFFKPEYLKKGEEFFLAHGQKSIIFARFFGPVRPVVPFVAGLFKMSKQRFFFFNIVSAFLSAPLYLLLGYFFGTAWTSISKLTGRVQMFALLLAAVLGVLYVFKNSLLKIGGDFFVYLKNFWILMIKQLALYTRLEFFLANHAVASKYAHGLWHALKSHRRFPTLLAWYGIFFVIVCSGAMRSFLQWSYIHQTDLAVENFFYDFRHPFWAVVFLIITWFGSLQAIVMVSSAVGCWWYKNRQFYFFPALLFTLILSTFSMYITKQLVHQVRPDWGLAVYAEKLFSFPSGHTTLAVALYGFIVFSLCYGEVDWNKKVNRIFAGGIIIFFISLSRLYLGVHYLSDVLGGYALGLICLLLGVEVARRIILLRK